MADDEYKIGDAARASSLTVKTIRYYEDIGLIPQARRRNRSARTGGNRVYGEDDIGRLRFIHHARLLGLGLSEIRELVAIAEERGCPGSKPGYRDVLTRHLSGISERIDRLVRLRQTMEELISTDKASRPGECTWGSCRCMESAEKRA